MASNKNSIIVMDYDGCGSVLVDSKNLFYCIAEWKQTDLLLNFILKIQNIIDNSNNVYFISGSNRVNGKIDTELALQNKNGESLVEFRKMIKYINDNQLTFIDYMIYKLDKLISEKNWENAGWKVARVFGHIITAKWISSTLDINIPLVEFKNKLIQHKTSNYKHKPITYVDLSTQFVNKFSHVDEFFNKTNFKNDINDGEVDVKVEIFKSVIGYMGVNNIQQMYYFDDDGSSVNKTKIVSRFFPAMIKWCNKTKSVDNGFEYKGKYIELIVFDYQLYLDLNPNVDLCYVKNKTEKCERTKPPEEEELCNIELRF